ncbi:MAG: aromatic ring-hydroxylating oxygenase subunit alpha [Solirubrobacteraceae bacterium]
MPTPFTEEELAPTRMPLLEASLLPPRAYVDETVAAWEREHLFLGGWVCVAHVAQLRERGDYLTREVGGESLLLVADDDGRPRGFHNVCRHRGARLVDSAEGRLRRLQCPYHAWSYGFDGRLRNAPRTEALADFDRACHGLTPVRTAVLEGLVFCDVSGAAAALEEHVGSLAAELARYRTGELRRAAAITYDVAANWKAIAENYSECLHCPGVHPELNRLSHYESGEEYEGPGAWCGGSMTLNEGAHTMASGGGHETRPPIAGIDGEALRSVLYFALFPNGLVSLHPDYVMLHTLWPEGAGRTRVYCEWFFEPATIERPGFDPGDAVSFWDRVNRQDWEVCELTQKGIGSRGYRRGRFTSAEITVHAFDQMVAEAYLERAPAAVP